MNKRNKGITLVALVITIIVLLIMAGVSIALVVGDNGVVTQSVTAKKNTVIGQEKEEITLAYSSALTKNLGDRVTDEHLQAELDISVGPNLTSVTQNTDDTLNVWFRETNHNYTVRNGKVTDAADGTTPPTPTTPDEPETPTGDPIVNIVLVGDYVDINVPYTNKQGVEIQYDHNGWRVLNINTETGVVKLISTKHPLTFFHIGSPASTSVDELEKISSEVLNIDSSSHRGYTANGFSTNDVKSLFNNTLVFSGISIPVQDDISGISTNNDLRKTAENYWLATASSDDNRLNYVQDIGTISGGSYFNGGVRPMVTLTSGVTIKDGDGTSANPYRLNEINYE